MLFTDTAPRSPHSLVSCRRHASVLAPHTRYDPSIYPSTPRLFISSSSQVKLLRLLVARVPRGSRPDHYNGKWLRKGTGIIFGEKRYFLAPEIKHRLYSLLGWEVEGTGYYTHAVIEECY